MMKTGKIKNTIDNRSYQWYYRIHANNKYKHITTNITIAHFNLFVNRFFKYYRISLFIKRRYKTDG